MLGLTPKLSEGKSCVSPSCHLPTEPDTGLWGIPMTQPIESYCTQESTLDQKLGSIFPAICSL